MEEVDEAFEQRARLLWRYEDYAKAVSDTIEQRDDHHRKAQALAKECDARYGERPDIPPVLIVIPGTH